MIKLLLGKNQFEGELNKNSMELAKVQKLAHSLYAADDQLKPAVQDELEN